MCSALRSQGNLLTGSHDAGSFVFLTAGIDVASELECAYGEPIPFSRAKLQYMMFGFHAMT